MTFLNVYSLSGEQVSIKGNQEQEFDGEDFLDSNDLDGQSLSDVEVRISKDQFSAFELLRNIDRNKIILAPEFQRNDVWKDNQRSELIESILMNIPIPLIYLFEDKKGIKQVVDGRQRLTSLKRFLNNEFKLTQLKVKSEHNGKTFKELPAELQAKIEDYQINAYVIQPPTPEIIKFNIFDRVNRAGTQLNKQEMRHALYQGRATELLADLSNKLSFLSATGGSLKPDRMRDRYAVLRFISFYLLASGQLKNFEYRSNIDDFMSYVMEYINTEATLELLSEMTKVFDRAMLHSAALFQGDGFRFNNPNGVRRPINLGLLELVAYALQDELPDGFNKVEIRACLEKSKAQIDLLGTFDKGATSTSSVKFRIKEAERLRQEIKVL